MEELSGMEDVFEKVKGHNSSLSGVQTFKEMEEKVKRLQDYNTELRRALVEVHRVPHPSSHRIINVVDNDNDEQKASENSDQMSSLVTNALTFPALVLDNIFGYLNVRNLQECRLICHEWNTIASSMLRKTNHGNGLVVKLKVKSIPTVNDEEQPPEEKESEDEEEKEDDNNIIVPDHKRYGIQELYSIVKTAPKDWFKTLYLSECCFERREFRKLFEDFGDRLKIIEIASKTVQVEGLHSILLDWCSNLEQLKLSTSFSFDGWEAEELNIPPTRSLKLTHFSLAMNGERYQFLYNNVRQVLMILKSSPNLKTLEFLGESAKCTTPLFEQLKLFPHILDNLEQIFLANPYPRNPLHYDPLKELSKIQFQPKFKHFVSTNIIQKDGPALSSLLSKTAESLEKLTLISIKGEMSYPADRPDRRLKFSEMNRLQEFRYLAHRELLIHSVDVVAMMPNLKILMISFEHHCEKLSHERQETIDNLFSNCQKLLITPHTLLKELYLFRFVRKPPATFGLINKIFPNLNKLGVALTPMKTTYSKDYYTQFFEAVTKFKHLSRLYVQWKTVIDARKYNEHHDYINISSTHSTKQFTKGLSCLKDLPKLTHLTIHTENEIPGFEEEPFLAIPKLQRLTLIGVSMDVGRAIKLKESLSERNIVLEIKNALHFSTDNYSLEWDSKDFLSYIAS